MFSDKTSIIELLFFRKTQIQIGMWVFKARNLSDQQVLCYWVLNHLHVSPLTHAVYMLTSPWQLYCFFLSQRSEYVASALRRITHSAEGK